MEKFKNYLKQSNDIMLFVDKVKKYLLRKPHRIKMLARCLSLFEKTIEPEKWVFIVGCYDSGTSLLKKIISSHSQISTFHGEGAFFTDELITPEELGWPRMWCQVGEKVRLTEKDNHINAEKVKKDWSLLFNKEKKIFLEKSIVNSARILWLNKNFKNSYFIFIVRNGYAVSEGIRRRAKTTKWKIKYSPYENGYPIELCAKQWFINNKIIENDAKSIKRFKKVFYEDICEKPNEIISDIYKFLGLKNKITWTTGTKWKIHDYNMEIKNLNAKSIERLTVNDISNIEKVASSMLDYYGYKPPVK